MANLKLVVTNKMDEIDATADNLTCTYDFDCDIVVEYNLNGVKTRNEIGEATIRLRITVNEKMTAATHDIIVGRDRFGAFGVDLDDSIDFGEIDVEQLKSEYVTDCKNSYGE